jgi:hypothetical protein
MIEKRDTNDDAKQWNDHVDAAHGYWCCKDILYFSLLISLQLSQYDKSETTF